MVPGAPPSDGSPDPVFRPESVQIATLALLLELTPATRYLLELIIRFLYYRIGSVIALEVIVQEGENLERALRKFKRKVQRSGLYSELRKRRFYEKPSAQRKRKREAAIRRERRRVRRDDRPRR